MKIIGIDYGKKNIGISTIKKNIIIPLKIIIKKKIIFFLKKYNKLKIIFIIGIPKTINKKKFYHQIKNFICILKLNFPQNKIFKQNEKYSSKIGYNLIYNGNFKKKKKIDQLSSNIILNNFINEISKI